MAVVAATCGGGGSSLASTGASGADGSILLLLLVLLVSRRRRLMHGVLGRRRARQRKCQLLPDCRRLDHLWLLRRLAAVAVVVVRW